MEQDSTTSPKPPSNRRLTTLNVAAILLLAIIAMVAILYMCTYEQSALLRDCLTSLPQVMKDSRESAERRYNLYMDEYDTRGNLGAILLQDSENIDEQELTRVRDQIYASQISIVDAEGNILTTTHAEPLGDTLASCIYKLVRSPKSVVDYNVELTEDNNGETIVAVGESQGDILADANLSQGIEGQDDATGETTAESEESEDDVVETVPVLFKHALGDDRYLVIEFGYEAIGTLYQAQISWDFILNQVLTGNDMRAFLEETDGTIVCFPYDAFEIDKLENVENDVHKLLKSRAGINVRTDNGSSNIKYQLTEIDGKLFWNASQKNVADEVNSFIVAIPIENLLESALLSSIALIVFLAFTFYMLVKYAKRNATTETYRGETGKGRTKLLLKRCAPGFFIAALVSSVFIYMLVMLESSSQTAAVTSMQRSVLEYDITHHSKLKDRLEKDYTTVSIAYTRSIAGIMSEHPEMRNRDALIRLADNLELDCVMLFDSDGKEICASNSYGNLTIGTSPDDPSSVFQPVLKGYPYAITESVVDELLDTKTHMVGAAIQGAEGQPDGMVVAIFDDTKIDEITQEDSVKNVVESYSVPTGFAAFVSDDATNKIIARTADSKVVDLSGGEPDLATLTQGYEGYGQYEGKYSYVSARSNGENTTIAIAIDATKSEDLDDYIWNIILCTLLVMSLLIFLTVRHIAREDSEELPTDSASTLIIFGKGYTIYFSLLALFAAFAVSKGSWFGFTYVFSGLWTEGVHLFSLWASIFFVALVNCCSSIVRYILDVLDKEAHSGSKTLLRLTGSIVSYTAAFIILFGVLGMLGVNTTALLASAGVVSIAVGMGSKDLITDLLAGVMILFEGSLRVGDIVEVGPWHGRVTDIGIRSCRITNDKDDIKIIANSNIKDIVNMTRGKTRVTLDFEVPNTKGIDETVATFEGFNRTVAETLPELKDFLSVDGVKGSSDTSYVVRLSFATSLAESESHAQAVRETVDGLIRQAWPDAEADRDKADRTTIEGPDTDPEE